MADENLQKFYTELERDQRVSVSDNKVKDIQSGVEKIVRDIFKNVEKIDNRFKLTMVKTGSFYDDAKVIEPDEFDYVAELDSLSNSRGVEFRATGDPAFLHVKLKNFSLREQWREFMTNPRHLKLLRAYSMSHLIEGGFMVLSEAELKHDDVILSPVLMQKRFRKLVDESYKTLNLPKGWEHGGFAKPQCSGVRRHGPATMIQLMYRTAADVYKINVDITLGIALPLPIDPEEIKMNFTGRIPKESPIRRKILQCLEKGPPLHAIPLYSKMLVKTKRFENKISWRVSCSGIEKNVFDDYPFESGVKVCMRTIKAVRDLFLADDRRKTHRAKRKTIKLKPGESSSSNRSGNRRNDTPWDNYIVTDAGVVQSVPSTSVEHTIHDNEAFISKILVYERNNLTLGACFETPQDQMATQLCQEGETENSLLSEHPESSGCETTTDLTDDNEGTDSDAQLEAKMRVFQLRDVSDMNTKPGSGEYYGPRTYMPSIEIKSYIFNLITLFSEEQHWNMTNVCVYVRDFFLFYHNLLMSRHFIKHYFFDTIVSSPFDEEQRIKALEKYELMLKIKSSVMAGTLSYEKIATMISKKSLPTIIEQDIEIDMRSHENNVCSLIPDFIEKQPATQSKKGN